MVFCATLVSVFVSLTLALGMKAPEGSATVPRTAPMLACGQEGMQAIGKSVTTRRNLGGCKADLLSGWEVTVFLAQYHICDGPLAVRNWHRRGKQQRRPHRLIRLNLSGESHFLDVNRNIS